MERTLLRASVKMIRSSTSSWRFSSSLGNMELRSSASSSVSANTA